MDATREVADFDLAVLLEGEDGLWHGDFGGKVEDRCRAELGVCDRGAVCHAAGQRVPGIMDVHSNGFLLSYGGNRGQKGEDEDCGTESHDF
jgi:hypothetical protein